MSRQLQGSEASPPDKQALASVLKYLEKQNLKETAQALKRELGIHSEAQLEQLGSNSASIPATSHRHNIEPAKYEESYSSVSSSSSTSTTTTKADLQSAPDATTQAKMPPTSLKEIKQPFSWPGSLSRIKMPKPFDFRTAFDSTVTAPDKAPFRANIRSSSPLQVSPVTIQANTPLTQIPIGAPFVYQLGSSPGFGVQQAMLTPILTMLPTKPVVVATPAQSVMNPAQGLSMSLTAPRPANTTPEEEKPSPKKQGISRASPPTPKTTLVHVAEPTTGQAIVSSSLIISETTQFHMPKQHSPLRTLASISPTEMTPQYSELKAFAEKFKTKRIQLGFTQGAVGQSLAEKGYSNFAQSTISRFEQMQLSPTNAAAIKQVLEKWLMDAESPLSAHSSTTTSGSDTIVTSRKRKKRAVFTPHTRTSLEEFFKQNPRPNRSLIEAISQQLDLLPEEVRVWFCNKRQKQKQQQGTVYHYPFESQSSITTSPSSHGTTVTQQRTKRGTPSPKTSFTIEELSKSSTSSTPSPIQSTAPFLVSPPTGSTPQSMFPMLMAQSPSNISSIAPPFLPSLGVAMTKV